LYEFIFTHALERNLIFHACCVAPLIMENLPQAHIKKSNLQLKDHHQHLYCLAWGIIFGLIGITISMNFPGLPGA